MNGSDTNTSLGWRITPMRLKNLLLSTESPEPVGIVIADGGLNLT